MLLDLLSLRCIWIVCRQAELPHNCNKRKFSLIIVMLAKVEVLRKVACQRRNVLFIPSSLCITWTNEPKPVESTLVAKCYLLLMFYSCVCVGFVSTGSSWCLGVWFSLYFPPSLLTRNSLHTACSSWWDTLTHTQAHKCTKPHFQTNVFVWSS